MGVVVRFAKKGCTTTSNKIVLPNEFQSGSSCSK